MQECVGYRNRRLPLLASDEVAVDVLRDRDAGVAEDLGDDVERGALGWLAHDHSTTGWGCKLPASVARVVVHASRWPMRRLDSKTSTASAHSGRRGPSIGETCEKAQA